MSIGISMISLRIGLSISSRSNSNIVMMTLIIIGIIIIIIIIVIITMHIIMIIIIIIIISSSGSIIYFIISIIIIIIIIAIAIIIMRSPCTMALRLPATVASAFVGAWKGTNDNNDNKDNNNDNIGQTSLGEGQLRSALIGSLHILSLFDGGTCWVPIYQHLSIVRTFFPQPDKSMTFAAAPLVLTPFVRSQGASLVLTLLLKVLLGV